MSHPFQDLFDRIPHVACKSHCGLEKVHVFATVVLAASLVTMTLKASHWRTKYQLEKEVSAGWKRAAHAWSNTAFVTEKSLATNPP